jgi:hypothetical protein
VVIQTAGLAIGGFTPPTNTGTTEEYNGTSWATSPGSLNTVRRELTGVGIQTAALAFGGNLGPTYSNATEEYNGTSWTSSNPLNTARAQPGGAGIQTAALAFGGFTPSPPVTNTTEEYDGNSWTTLPATLGTTRANSAGTGIQTSALASGGDTGPGLSAATEEYNVYGEPNTFQNAGQVWYNGTTKALKFTDSTLSSAWATGNNMNTSRYVISRSWYTNSGFSFWGYYSNSYRCNRRI